MLTAHIYGIIINGIQYFLFLWPRRNRPLIQIDLFGGLTMLISSPLGDASRLSALSARGYFREDGEPCTQQI